MHMDDTGLTDLKGSLRLAGSARLNAGVSLVSVGKAILRGSVKLGAGRTLSCSGSLPGVLGEARLRHGVTFLAGGSVSLGGRMLGSTRAAYSMNLSAPVCLGGMSLFDVTTRSPFIDTVFIATRRSSIEVFSHGV